MAQRKRSPLKVPPIPRWLQRFSGDYVSVLHNWIVIAAGLISGIFAAVTIVRLCCFKAEDPFWKVAFVIWTVVPPIWMWAEYWVMWRHDRCSKTDGALEKFKYGQEVGVKVWLAFATMLALLLFKG